MQIAAIFQLSVLDTTGSEPAYIIFKLFLKCSPTFLSDEELCTLICPFKAGTLLNEWPQMEHDKVPSGFFLPEPPLVLRTRDCENEKIEKTKCQAHQLTLLMNVLVLDSQPELLDGSRTLHFEGWEI